MSQPDYSVILERLYPGVEWALNGDDVENIEWHGDGPAPTRAELDNAWAMVEHNVATERVRALRQAAFAAEADPLYMEWQAGEGTEQAWLDARAAIRTRYPYPVEL